MRFQRVAEANIRANLKYYLEAIKSRDPHIVFLERLGFKISLTGNIVVPKLSLIFEKISAEVEKLVANGKIAREDALFPARVFIATDGEYLFLKFGESIPEGATPATDLLPDRIYYSMIAKGFFPVGEPSKKISRHAFFSVPEHDLGHFSVMLGDPSIMRSMRRSATQVMRRLPPGRPNEFPDSGLVHKLNKRLYFSTELLSLFNPEDRGRLQKQLALPGMPKKRMHWLFKWIGSSNSGEEELITVQMTEKSLKKLDVSQFADFVAALRSAYDANVRHIGGAAADVVHRAKDHPALARSIAALRKKLDRPLEEIDHRSVAALRVALLELSQITPEEWIEESLSEKISEKSKLYRAVCRSGIWSDEPSNWIYRAYCE